MTNLSPNPYIGAWAFEEIDSHKFFGRETEIQQLASLVVSQRAVILHAQAGVGKTSLLQAGLIPHLRAGQKMQILPIGRVGGDLPEAMAETEINNIYVFNLLRNILTETTSSRDIAGLALSQGLQRYFDRQADEMKRRPHLLVVDQFEELFSTYPHHSPAREGFFLQLQQCLRHNPHLNLLLAMRQRYISQLDLYAVQFPDRLQNRLYLDRLQTAAALQAIQKPAGLAGCMFAGGVAETLVDDLRRVQTSDHLAEAQQFSPTATLPTSTADSPGSNLGLYVEPLHLQLVCHRLWNNLPPGRQMILSEDLREFADVDQVLIDLYEPALTKVLTTESITLSERALRAWFTEKLITPAKTRALAYRDEQQDQTEGIPNAAVDILSETYLIRAEMRGDDTWYQLAHDRLIESILTANQTWQANYHNPLANATQTWLAAGRSPKNLLAGDPLAEAQAFAEANPLDVNPEEEEFLATCRRREAAKQAEFERAARRRRNTLIALIIVLLLLIFLGYFAVQQVSQGRQAQQEAENSAATAALARATADTAQAEAASARTEAATARVEATKQAQLAQDNANIAATAQAEATRQAQLAAQRAAEAETAQALAKTQTILARAYQLAAQSANELNRNNHELALALAIEAGRITDTLEAADAIRGALLHPWHTTRIFYGHAGSVRHVTWNKNERNILTSGDDGTARVWDVESGLELIKLEGHSGGVWQAIWNGDESRILTGSDDGTARIWNAQTGAEQILLQGHTGGVRRAIWNRAESRILTSSDDGTARVWDALTGAELFALKGHTGGVWQAIWSQDEGRILTGSDDGTARIWDAQTGQELLVVRGHSGAVRQAVWGCILTSSDDGTARIWNDRTGKELVRLEGHTGGVWQAILSQNDTWVLTGSEDGTARIWRTKTGQELVKLEGHTAGVRQATWSQDENRILTGSEDSTARIWDAQTGAELARLKGHTAPVTKVLWSRDESRILTSSEDGSVRLWAAQVADVLETLEDQTEYIPTSDLIDVACGVLPRNMTSTEWYRFMTGPYEPTCENAPVPPDVAGRMISPQSNRWPQNDQSGTTGHLARAQTFNPQIIPVGLRETLCRNGSWGIYATAGAAACESYGLPNIDPSLIQALIPMPISTPVPTPRLAPNPPTVSIREETTPDNSALVKQIELPYPVPYGENAYIYGVHDKGGEHLMIENGEAKGWVLVSEVIGADPNDRRGRNYTDLTDQGLGVIVVLVNAHGPDGTIPLADQCPNFAQRATNFVGSSLGAHIWVIGNEMNLQREQPRRPDTSEPQLITPRDYADCYRQVREAIKSLSGREDDQVIMAAISPWSSNTFYAADPEGRYTANQIPKGSADDPLLAYWGDYIKYLQDTLLAIGPDNIDGIAIHAYTHGSDPNLIFSDSKLDPPFEDYYYQFRTYQDQMNAIPPEFQHLPVYLTEIDQNEAWVDINSGWVQNVYEEINNWNAAGNQPIRAAILYRWSMDDKWTIEDKFRVQADFQAAVTQNYQWTHPDNDFLEALLGE
jgi:WD40 repeat protein